MFEMGAPYDQMELASFLSCSKVRFRYLIHTYESSMEYFKHWWAYHVSPITKPYTRQIFSTVSPLLWFDCKEWVFLFSQYVCKWVNFDVYWQIPFTILKTKISAMWWNVPKFLVGNKVLSRVILIIQCYAILPNLSFPGATIVPSVTILGDFLHIQHLFKAFGNN